MERKIAKDKEMANTYATEMKNACLLVADTDAKKKTCADDMTKLVNTATSAFEAAEKTMKEGKAAADEAAAKAKYTAEKAAELAKSDADTAAAKKAAESVKAACLVAAGTN